MTDPVKDALAATRRAQGAIGNAPVFRAPKDPHKPCSRHLFDTWLRKAYEIAEIPRERWTMWHSIRRKWATERKGYPVRDVMEARGREERGGAASFVSAARCRDSEAGGVASDAADCELLSRTHNKTHNTGRRRRKNPTAKVAAGLDLHSVGTAGFEPATR